MSYNNLLYLLVVIFLLSVGQTAPLPQFAATSAVLLFVIKLALFFCFIAWVYRPRLHPLSIKDSLRAERSVALAAIISLTVDIFVLGMLPWLANLPLIRMLPLFAQLLGLGLFFFYLTIGWYKAARCSGAVMGEDRPWSFILENLQAMVPIVLPWVFISLFFDLVTAYGPLAWRDFLASEYGELSLLGLFFLFISLVYPPLLMRLWHCRPLPAGEVKERMEAMCAYHQLAYRDIMLWPLMGGQAVTAGVIGFVKWFRYVLVTPLLLQVLTWQELEAVLAHEIGHVKRYHMQLYLLLLIGFSVIVSPLLDLTLAFLVQSNIFYTLIALGGISFSQGLEWTTNGLLLLLLVVFLRFIFGFFLRNFERQADLYAFVATGSSLAIAHALEKVAQLSGNIRELPNWHHFGIGQRVNFLVACVRQPALVGRHHRKVYCALAVYAFMVVLAVFLHFNLPVDLISSAKGNRDVRVLTAQLQENPGDVALAWALANLHYGRQEYKKTVNLYNDILELAPNNVEVLNNLAWLLVTCEDSHIHDGPYALLLARRAVRLHRVPYILDTLAHVYWFLGRRQEAVEAEEEAVGLAKAAEQEYYQRTLGGWRWLMQEEGQLLPETSVILPD